MLHCMAAEHQEHIGRLLHVHLSVVTCRRMSRVIGNPKTGFSAAVATRLNAKLLSIPRIRTLKQCLFVTYLLSNLGNEFEARDRGEFV